MIGSVRAVAAVAALVLLVAANTSVEGFPGLASRLARDGFLPRQLASRGDRLTFSNGILLLAVAAIILVVATNASATTLIQLYLVGVFASFVVGQLGMVLHWNKRLRLVIDPKARMRMRINRLINGVGCVIAAGVLIVLRDHRRLRRYMFTLMLAGLMFLLLPLIPGLGQSINGARIWISIWPLAALLKASMDGLITCSASAARVSRTFDRACTDTLGP